MNFRSQQHQQAHNGMNLVPLIDVLFILLIFFIVTFAMARFETELNVSVPAADKAEASARSRGELVVNVRQDGTIVMNSIILDENSLLTRLSEVGRVDRKRAVIIRGDKLANFEGIVKVLSVIHKAGLFHVSFATQQSDKAGS